jgi:hypothetical protein
MRSQVYLRNNYLHFGNSLEYLPYLAGVEDKTALKDDLRTHVLEHFGHNRFIDDIISTYGYSYSRRINMAELSEDIHGTLRLREQFGALECRGFSYKLYDRIGFCYPLKKQINLRVALLADEDLFYPPRIRRYLKAVRANHYFRNGYPSLAYALGTRQRGNWFIFAMQSDLAGRKPAYIREHLRGWRRILFGHVIRLATDSAESIFLSRAADVLRACHPDYQRPLQPPAAWKAIYEKTADFFGMRAVTLDEGVDIQIFRGQPVVPVKRFFRLKLTEKTKARIKGIFGG